MTILGKEGNPTGDDDNIYIDLDCLLDTVLGTLSKINPQLAVVNLQSGGYSTRKIDRFIGITDEEFKKAYAARDIETLKHSVVTNVPFFLQRLIKDSLLAAAAQSTNEKMCFTLNVHPYKIEDPAFVEMLMACLRFHTYSSSSICIVSYSNEELTPKHCLDNYQIMLKYDWRAWVAAHKTVFESSGVPSLTIVTPELFVDTVPTKEDLASIGARDLNPFTETTRAIAALVRLKFMPVSLFSISEKITAKNSKEVVNYISVTEEDIINHLNENNSKATLIREDPLPVVDLSSAYELF